VTLVNSLKMNTFKNAATDHSLLIFLILYEVITVVFVWRLWTRKSRPGIIELCLLSIVLFIPFCGWFLYLFLWSSPDAHGENPGGYNGSDVGGDYGGGGGHH
jgi:hypothetical protein